MTTTVQCSIPSQLNNKPRVVVTDFRLYHTCSIIILLWLHSLSVVIRNLHLLCNPHAFNQAIIIIISVCLKRFMSTCTSYVPTHIYIADMRTKEVSKCTLTSERSVFS